MRPIDADELIKGLKISTGLLNGGTLVPVNLLITLIEKSPTIVTPTVRLREVSLVQTQEGVGLDLTYTRKEE